MLQNDNARSSSGPVEFSDPQDQAEFITALEKYARAVFHELTRIQNSDAIVKDVSQKSINSYTFWQFSRLPKLVSDRIFFGKRPEGKWTCIDLIEWLNLESRGSLTEQQKTVFKLLDFDHNGLVSMQDCETVLNHSMGNPMRLSKSQTNKRNSKIKKIIYSCFKSEITKSVRIMKYAEWYAEGKWDIQDEIWSSICQQSQAEKKIKNFQKLIQESKPDFEGQLPRSFSTVEERKVPNEVVCEGSMYTLLQSWHLQAHYYKIVNRELYKYSSKVDHNFTSMIYLGHGACVVPFTPVIESSSSKPLYGLTLVSGDKTVDLYILGHSHYNKWKSAFAKATGIKCDISADYLLTDNILGSKKSNIKLGICRKTGKKVAIQAIKKSKHDKAALKEIIEISKMCKHQNLVELLDVYQDLEQIYLVTQYFGVTLRQYKESLTSRQVSIEGTEMIGILKQILLVLQYLKKYNIVHRNITTDHILLTGRFYDVTYKAKRVQVPEIKLTNFLSSTILMPHEEIVDRTDLNSILMEFNELIDLYSFGALIYKSVPGLFPPVKPIVLNCKQQADLNLRLINETNVVKLERQLKALKQFFAYMMQSLLDRHIYEYHLSCDALLDLPEFQLCVLPQL